MYHWLLGGRAPGPPRLSVNASRATPSAWCGSPVQRVRMSVAGTGDTLGAVSSVSVATSTPGGVQASTTASDVVDELLAGVGSFLPDDTVALLTSVAVLAGVGT